MKSKLEETFNQLKTETYNQLHIVVGFVKDKDLQNVLKLFPQNALLAGRLFSVASGFVALSGIFVLLFYLFIFLLLELNPFRLHHILDCLGKQRNL